MGLGTVHCQPSDRQQLEELIKENVRYREALKKIAFSSMTKTEAQLCKIASDALFKTEGNLKRSYPQTSASLLRAATKANRR